LPLNSTSQASPLPHGLPGRWEGLSPGAPGGSPATGYSRAKRPPAKRLCPPSCSAGPVLRGARRVIVSGDSLPCQTRRGRICVPYQDTRVCRKDAALWPARTCSRADGGRFSQSVAPVLSYPRRSGGRHATTAPRRRSTGRGPVF
jgi:hypothetical protein